MVNTLFNKVLGEKEKKNVSFIFTLKLKEIFGQPNTSPWPYLCPMHTITSKHSFLAGKCSFLARHFAPPNKLGVLLVMKKGGVEMGLGVSSLCQNWDNRGRLPGRKGPQLDPIRAHLMPGTLSTGRGGEASVIFPWEGAVPVSLLEIRKMKAKAVQ